MEGRNFVLMIGDQGCLVDNVCIKLGNDFCELEGMRSLNSKKSANNGELSRLGPKLTADTIVATKDPRSVPGTGLGGAEGAMLIRGCLRGKGKDT